MSRKRCLFVIAALMLCMVFCNRQSPRQGNSLPQTILGEHYQYTDHVAPSANPPRNLVAASVPQLVAFGFDDNGFSGLPGASSPGGLQYIRDLFKNYTDNKGKDNPATFDNTPARFSFYGAAQYIGAFQNESHGYVRKAWHGAVEEGNEIGNHTYSHHHGTDFTLKHWLAEIQLCNANMFKPFDSSDNVEQPSVLLGIGIKPSQMFGFRTPFLEYSDTVFVAIKKLGFLYDCSIEEGWQEHEDGTNFLWPYTLDQGSPGNAQTTKDSVTPLIGKHPGLWELPNYAVIVPHDTLCAAYNVSKGFRARMYKVHPDYFDTLNGKITGLDWNLWVDFQMTQAEFVAALNYTLDLRIMGNRCPVLFGAHSDIYADGYQKLDSLPNTTPQNRRDGLKEFLEYALSKPEVRVVTNKQVIDWMRNPQRL